MSNRDDITGTAHDNSMTIEGDAKASFIVDHNEAADRASTKVLKDPCAVYGHKPSGETADGKVSTCRFCGSSY